MYVLEFHTQEYDLEQHEIMATFTTMKQGQEYMRTHYPDARHDGHARQEWTLKEQSNFNTVVHATLWGVPLNPDFKVESDIID